MQAPFRVPAGWGPPTHGSRAAPPLQNDGSEWIRPASGGLFNSACRAHRTESMPPRSRRSLNRLFAPFVVVAVALAVRPEPARAQVGSAAVGAVGGFAVGAYTTLAIYVTKARFGRYLFSPDDLVSLSPEFLPVIVGPVAWGWIGAESSTALGRSAGWGALGLIGGAAAGGLTGKLVSDSDEAPWAGAIIGGGIGLLTGAILGALDGFDDDGGEGLPVGVTFSIPLGGG